MLIGETADSIQNGRTLRKQKQFVKSLTSTNIQKEDSYDIYPSDELIELLNKEGQENSYLRNGSSYNYSSNTLNNYQYDYRYRLVYKVREYELVEEGQNIIDICFDDPKITVSFVAKRKGYVIPKHKYYLSKDKAVCSIYDDIKTLIQYSLNGYVDIINSKDSFTSNDFIEVRDVLFLHNLIMGFYPLYSDNTSLIRFIYSNKSLPIRKGDAINFLFDDGTSIPLNITSKPVQNLSSTDKSIRICDVPLSFDDLNCFSNKTIKKIRINTASADTIEGTLMRNDFGSEIVEELYRELFSNYSKKLNELNISLLKDNEQNTTESTKPKDGTCYVYIMKDEKNRCFKIGISNKPEYREKTLQSDKPFITMLKAKEFPSRKIARAFESALHSTFAEKNIRGEWFDLSSEEVEQVINALK